MLHSIPDPFDSYGPPKPEDQIFSILTPLAIFSSSASPSPQTAPAEIDPSSSFSGSPTGVSWANDQTHEDDDATYWAGSRTPTGSSPPPSAKSIPTVTGTRERERAISFPGASSSKRSSHPPHTPPNKSPARSPPSAKRAESKLRKSLSSISEASTSTAHAALAEPPWSSPAPAEATTTETATTALSDAHRREESSDTIRGLVDTVATNERRASTSGMNGMSSFAELPVWGTHSSPTSPAPAHAHEHGHDGDPSS